MIFSETPDLLISQQRKQRGGTIASIDDAPRIHISNRAQNFNFPKSRLRWAGECGILFPSCLSKAR